MANLIKVKRTNTASSVPSLVYGEIGWNSADSKLYVGSFANASVQVGGSSLVVGVDVQAYDAGLQSLAGIATTGADRLIYATATDVYTTSAFTAFGRSLVDDVDASASRTTLGLVIGTNVQAYDAGLLSIAAATTAADRFLYTTALDVYAVATITTFGRSLVDDVDAATARTTIGLVIGTDVAPVASPTFTGVVTTAGQIVFPASVNLSADANTLDDYEEGTFTPTFTASTTNPSVTYDAAVRYGIYVKIGKTIFISGSVSITVLTSAGSGNLQISGLPFTSSSGLSGGFASLSIGYKTGWTTTTPGTAYVQASATYIQLGNESMSANINTTNLSATSYIQFAGFYNTTS